jgi:uncharacterized protein YaiL (DUF2058 family)
MGLREELLKAGLVSQQQVQGAEQLDKARERVLRPGKGRAPAAPPAAKPLGEAEREALAREVAALVDAHRVPVERGGRRWYVPLRGGRIVHLDVPDKVAADLEAGHLAVVADGHDRPAVVTRAGAEAIHLLDPSTVRCFNRA